MINNTTIKITRLSNIIYPSREVVILALDNVYHLIGQFILAEYRDELGNINTILVIGKSNGRGHDSYSVISTAGDFVVNKIEIPDVSQVGHQNPEVPHGEIYITHKKIDPNDENSEEDWFLVSCPENERVWKIIDRSRIFRNLDDGYRWFYIKETKTLKREDDFLSTAENQSYVELLLNNLNKPSIVVSYNNQTNDNFYIDELNTTIENPILNIHVTDFTGTDITENCIIKINNEVIEPETSDIHDFKFIGTLTTNTEITIESVYLDKIKILKTIRFYFPYEMYYGTCNLVNNEIIIDEESINSKLIYTNLTNISITFNLNKNRSIIIFPQIFGPFFHIFDINRLDYINNYTYSRNFEYNNKIFSAYYKNDIAVINNFLQRFTYVENYNLSSSEPISSGNKENVIEVVKVNGVVLPVEDKTVDVEVPTKTSDLTNDSGFITKLVDDLLNYYLKSETFNKAEVLALINAVEQFTYESVASLPTASSDTMHKIYLVPSADPQTSNVKDEYITIESDGSYSWEQIGNMSIDLSGYVTTSNLATALDSYTPTSQLATVATSGDYNDLENTPTIPTVPTNISAFTNDAGYLTQHQSLTNYVQKSQTAGLLKNDGTVDINTYLTQQDVSGKADKTSVVTLTETSVTQELEDNTVYQASTLSSLTITLPNGVTPNYISQINFTSGNTATTLTAQNIIVWFGDDITNDVFVPTTDKQYIVMFYYDGVNVRGAVQSYASQQNA